MLTVIEMMIKLVPLLSGEYHCVFLTWGIPVVDFHFNIWGNSSHGEISSQGKSHAVEFGGELEISQSSSIMKTRV